MCRDNSNFIIETFIFVLGRFNESGYAIVYNWQSDVIPSPVSGCLMNRFLDKCFSAQRLFKKLMVVARCRDLSNARYYSRMRKVE